MGKKRDNGQHATQSFGQMVSAAALAQLKPHIDAMVLQGIQRLGNKLAIQQAETLEDLYTRTIVLESILMDKFSMTRDDFANLLADKEDQREELTRAEEIGLGDVVRLEIKTKAQDSDEFTPAKRLKLYQSGTGSTIGTQLETGLLGMKTGESKDIKFGQNLELTANVKIERISRPKVVPAPEQAPKPVEAENASNA